MTDNQRLKLLESVEALDILTSPMKLYYDFIDGEVYLNKKYESIMKLYDIPYRMVEDEGETKVAMPINDSTYSLKEPGKPWFGGSFCFNHQVVYPIAKKKAEIMRLSS